MTDHNARQAGEAIVSAATCQCKCKACGKEFMARIADRRRGWAQCCCKQCAAIRRERKANSRSRQVIQFRSNEHDAARHAMEAGWDGHKEAF